MNRNTRTDLISFSLAGLFLAVFLVLHSAPAFSWEEPPWTTMDAAALAPVLSRGDLISVIREGSAEHAAMAVLIPVPPEKIWAVLSDAANYETLFPSCRKVQLKSRDKQHPKFQYLISIIDMGPVKIQVPFTLKATLEPFNKVTMIWNRDKNTALTVTWKLLPAGNKNTIVIMTLSSDLAALAPDLAWLIKQNSTTEFTLHLANSMGFLRGLLDRIGKKEDKKAK